MVHFTLTEIPVVHRETVFRDCRRVSTSKRVRPVFCSCSSSYGAAQLDAELLQRQSFASTLQLPTYTTSHLPAAPGELLMRPSTRPVSLLAVRGIFVLPRLVPPPKYSRGPHKHCTSVETGYSTDVTTNTQRRVSLYWGNLKH